MLRSFNNGRACSALTSIFWFRFQEGAETFETFKLQHEKLLKKVQSLRDAKNIAEEKNKAKTLFLANCCHELVRTSQQNRRAQAAVELTFLAERHDSELP